MTAGAPFFTILVPTYNQAHYLGACLDSIVAQTDPDWEAVVIDDGSTDATADLADRYAQRDPRIRVIHKPNGGVASALNEALRHARGDWICWLSSDDLFEPRKLEIDRREIERHPECRFFFSYFRLLQEETQELKDHYLWGPLPAPEFQLPTMFYRNYISGIAICISRRAWRQAGFFDESLRYGQDYDMWLRLLAANPARVVPAWTAVSRHHAQQGSALFQHACYYDTAKAALLFLNARRFAELFPLLDLTREEDAVRALDYAFDIAERQEGFLYALGANPSLVLRMLEWLFDDTGRDLYLGRMLRAIAAARIDRLATHEEPSKISFVWRLAAVLQRIPSLASFEPADPGEIGLCHYYRMRALGDPEAGPLATYLDRLHGISIPPAPARAGDVLEVLLRLPPDMPPEDAKRIMTRMRAVIDFMVRSGWKVLVLGTGPDRVEHREASVTIYTEQPLDEALASLFRERVWLVWGGSSRAAAEDEDLVFDLESSLPDEELAAALVTLLRNRFLYRRLPHKRLAADLRSVGSEAKTASRRQVIFICRALWGGGAERVMHQIAQELDVRRFEPIVVHFYNTRIAPSYRPDISVISLETLRTSGDKGRTSVPADTAESVTPPTARWPAVLLRLYNGLDPATRAHVRSVKRYKSARNALYRTVEAVRRLRAACRRRALPPPVNVPAPVPPSTQFYAAEVAIASIWPWAEALLDVLRQARPDAILLPMMEEATVAAFLVNTVQRWPYIASLHAVQSLYMGMLYGDPEQRGAQEWLLVAASRNAGMIVLPSRDACQDLIENYPVNPERVRCIANPVDVDWIARRSEEAIETPIANDDGKPLFVYVGRLSPEKRPDLVVDACRILRDRLADFQCLLLGEGSMRQELEQQVETHGLKDRVHLLGAVQNPFPYIKRARALVLTSWFESFGLVLVEALACGTPTIAVDCVGGPRDILKDGELGILVPPENAEALATAMLRIAQDDALHGRFSRGGPGRARQFAANEIVPIWEQAIDDVLERAVPAATFRKVEMADCRSVKKQRFADMAK